MEVIVKNVKGVVTVGNHRRRISQRLAKSMNLKVGKLVSGLKNNCYDEEEGAMIDRPPNNVN